MELNSVPMFALMDAERVKSELGGSNARTEVVMQRRTEVERGGIRGRGEKDGRFTVTPNPSIN